MTGIVSPEVDAYIRAAPETSRATLESLRLQVRHAAPEADECIRYGMPAFTYRGKRLLYFAAWKHHCAIYGTREGNLQFPHDKPPSPRTIARLVASRVAEVDGSTS